MNCITWFGVLGAVMVAASEAITLKKSILGSERETELYPLSSSAEASLVLSGRRFATALHKVIYYTTNYDMDFNAAKAYCESKGTYIATLEDLHAAYHYGYERCGCGWAANGISYTVTQEANTNCHYSIGVAQCSLDSKQGVFCRRPTPVIYYSTNYDIDFNAAKAYCESKGTYIATFEDLHAAYQYGYERCGCGWAANGILYNVMQEARDGCHSTIGVAQCSLESKRGVFCRRPTPVFISNDSRGDYKMTLAEARQHCQGKGTSLATFEDLAQAYGLGYEACNCGWTDNGFAYIIMQNPTQKCLSSVGVITCNWQNTWNAFCKGPYYTMGRSMKSQSHIKGCLNSRPMIKVKHAPGENNEITPPWWFVLGKA